MTVTTSIVSTVENPEQAALISSLRDMIQQQAIELENLRALSNRPPEPRENPQSVALIASLREQLQKQAGELEGLQKQTAETTRAREEEVRCFLVPTLPTGLNVFLQKISLVGRIMAAESDLKSTQEIKKEAEKEQEDLLVFLEELSGKRRRDKQRMREAGLDVSDDEGEAEE
jgi:intracellular protein transport protein USO1